MTYKRCFLLLADGARHDVFARLLQEGRLPNIQKYMVTPGGIRPAVSTFPSTTGPAYLPFLTGCHAGTCNVPGIRWFDRKKYARGGLPFRSFRSYVGFESYLLNRDLRPEIKTLFELLPRSVNIFSSINRGVPSKGNKTKNSRIWYWYYAHLTDHWSLIDKAAEKKILNVFEKEDPQFLFAVFPSIDEYSHIVDPLHPRTLQAYEGVDRAIGSIARLLEKQGRLQETLLGIVSDHGLSKTGKHLGLNELMEGMGYKTLFYPLIYKRGCVAAEMVSGNAMSHVYLKGKKGWEEPVLEEELFASYRPLMDKLLSSPEIDIIAYRNGSGEVVAQSRRGKGRIGFKNGSVHYRVEGGDPFGFGPLPEKMDLTEALERTGQTDYPDALVALAQLFLSERTGDLVLSASEGYDLRLHYEIHEHKGSHGSLLKEHMITPFIFNVPLNQKIIRTIDVFPTLLKLMGKEIPSGIDGKTLL
ncbi:MAG: alkaline phosphatase family protein [bacterium]|nr:alkaline phosphatase family protein [bacterium]